MPRATLDEYFMEVAKAVSLRSTCLDKQVGCVLVDVNKNIIATGYNGFPRRFNNQCCDTDVCIKDNGGTCVSVHAEQNALLRANADLVDTCYCTLEPCVDCTKMLLNTACTRVVFLMHSAKAPGPDLTTRLKWVCFND